DRPRHDEERARDRGSPRGDRKSRRARAAGRRRPDRGQGAREVPGGRQSHAAVRRRRGGTRGAGEAADELGRCVNPIALTATWVASATGGTVAAGDLRQAFDGVSIDTRTLKAGELFFAIRGDRFDGAQFAAAAVDAGAAGVVVPRGWIAKAAQPFRATVI